MTYKEALSKAMYLCSKTEKCKSDIRKKLYDWKANPDDIEKILSELEKQKFIDEKRYAEYYVRDKFRFNKWGKIKIKTMLLQKQIPEKTINKALADIPEKEYIETLKYLLKQKEKTLNDGDYYKKKQKIIRFLTSKGFETDTVLRILE
ncbi:MAG: RecX family transcriptional regulator [Chlorobi bacterium]|nr:RecX family transcriptional regulator [Chlorobiota bacterium]